MLGGDDRERAPPRSRCSAPAAVRMRNLPCAGRPARIAFVRLSSSKSSGSPSWANGPNALGPLLGRHPAGLLERAPQQGAGRLVVEDHRAVSSSRNGGVEMLVSRLRARISSSGFCGLSWLRGAPPSRAILSPLAPTGTRSRRAAASLPERCPDTAVACSHLRGRWRCAPAGRRPRRPASQPLAIPGSPLALGIEAFEGAPAQADPHGRLRVPQHPFMAPKAARTSTTTPTNGHLRRLGPAGRRDRRPLGAVRPRVRLGHVRPTGRIVTVCVGLDRPVAGGARPGHARGRSRPGRCRPGRPARRIRSRASRAAATSTSTIGTGR